MDFQANLYSKWRMELFRICVCLAFVGSITEVVIYLYDSSHRTLFLPDHLYQMRFIYIPSFLNLVVILLTYFVLTRRHFSDTAKNTWACLLIYFLCANTQVIHYVYGPLLMLPGVAIFVTILFNNKKLTIAMLITSLISLLIASRQASVELRKNDPQLLSDTCLAALVMIVIFVAAMLLENYVSQQLSYILSSNERQKELIEECNIDPMMEIGNRRALEHRIDILNQTALNDSLHLLMLDIDDFKGVNDTYGHLCGDTVLLTLGHLTKEHSLEAFRYGGEEVVILFSGISSQEAFEKAEDLRKNFSHICFTFAPKIRITFSAGLVTCQAKQQPNQWIEAADHLLYMAKSDGKNRIYMNGESPLSSISHL